MSKKKKPFDPVSRWAFENNLLPEPIAPRKQSIAYSFIKGGVYVDAAEPNSAPLVISSCNRKFWILAADVKRTGMSRRLRGSYYKLEHLEALLLRGWSVQVISRPSKKDITTQVLRSLIFFRLQRLMDPEKLRAILRSGFPF